ncbi:MAG: YebC/PmpR family DNA-binding transcriptional regulator [Bacilli bacterium]|nr:YebC/PmpR family DNA-binding transcriptional regulator [Bacilli bacterium]
MGRAHEVRKAAMAKTAAAKTKVYSKYGKEILIAAKAGVPDPAMNLALKHIIEKAKKEQVPADIIKRAIDKAKSGVGEDYSPVTYEGFGPGASTIIVECLTDNVNRTVSDVRTCFNKSHSKMGVSGCVSHSYQHVSLLSLKGMSEEEVLDALMEKNVDIINIEQEDDEIIITGSDTDLYNIKSALEKPGVEFDIEEITWEADEKVTLEGEDLELFNRLLSLLEECDDVQDVYHNVEL